MIYVVPETLNPGVFPELEVGWFSSSRSPGRWHTRSVNFRDEKRTCSETEEKNLALTRETIFL